jgi:DNA modification methylase
LRESSVKRRRKEMIKILQGNCLDKLKELPDQSVNTCITSPPYWGLRDYGEDKQLGMEDTPEEFVNNLVEVFREVKRVLRDDGTVWLNLGDSYCGTGNKGNHTDPKHKEGRNGQKIALNNKIEGLKSKDLVGIPWRVAFALQQDGWYLRQDIIWHKPNPMPESVRDRCTKSHEYIFLLSKSPKYYFDNEAIKEDSKYYGKDKRSDKGNIRYEGKRTSDKDSKAQQSFITINPKRNKRSVWTVTTKPFKGAHFATFPMDLIEPCVLAGCPENGTVLDPFGGSGTTGIVASNHNRKAVLIELNAEYIEIARQRIQDQGGLFTDLEIVSGDSKVLNGDSRV